MCTRYIMLVGALTVGYVRDVAVGEVPGLDTVGVVDDVVGHRRLPRPQERSCSTQLCYIDGRARAALHHGTQPPMSYMHNFNIEFK